MTQQQDEQEYRDGYNRVMNTLITQLRDSHDLISLFYRSILVNEIGTDKSAACWAVFRAANDIRHAIEQLEKHK